MKTISLGICLIDEDANEVIASVPLAAKWTSHFEKNLKKNYGSDVKDEIKEALLFELKNGIDDHEYNQLFTEYEKNKI